MTIAQAAGGLAVATAALGLWMALRHVAGARRARAAVATHLLAGAVLIELAVVATSSASTMTLWMIAAALVSGIALPLSAKSLPEGAGPLMLGHGAVALAATALVAVWALG